MLNSLTTDNHPEVVASTYYYVPCDIHHRKPPNNVRMPIGHGKRAKMSRLPPRHPRRTDDRVRPGFGGAVLPTFCAQ
eukprot:scaffold8471_cov184-Amphora_coffeaeformis.AAC.11